MEILIRVDSYHCVLDSMYLLPLCVLPLIYILSFYVLPFYMCPVSSFILSFNMPPQMGVWMKMDVQLALKYGEDILWQKLDINIKFFIFYFLFLLRMITCKKGEASSSQIEHFYHLKHFDHDKLCCLNKNLCIL